MLQQILTFISHNLPLFGALVVILAMLAYNLLGSRLRGYQPVSPSQAIQMINHDNAVVLDVREDGEYHNGHIINALHVPQGQLKNRLQELARHKDKAIIVSCRSGSRSGQACALLKKQGFDSIYNLAGGVMAWQSANLPLVKK
ncbi:MAG TPA: rhodanese-like domain-containing protein [Gammaproteobacteria bacterium]|nr:rhodanese-like domain-containing protein [Gammaproteobacteria bacterium]